MLVYRITKDTYLETYNGFGGSYSEGGRWNLPGIQAMYFALSPSVAMLEMANYTVNPRMVPPSYRLGVYSIPEGTPIDKLEKEDWPGDWHEHPFPDSTQALGSEWLKGGTAFGLILPSCAIPDGLESIMLVNPTHPCIQDIKLEDTKSEIFNPRAFPGT